MNTQLSKVDPKPQLLNPDGWVDFQYMSRETLEAVESYYAAASQADQVRLLERLLQGYTNFGGSLLYSRISAELAALRKETK